MAAAVYGGDTNVSEGVAAIFRGDTGIYGGSAANYGVNTANYGVITANYGGDDAIYGGSADVFCVGVCAEVCGGGIQGMRVSCVCHRTIYAASCCYESIRLCASGAFG